MVVNSLRSTSVYGCGPAVYSAVMASMRLGLIAAAVMSIPLNSAAPVSAEPGSDASIEFLNQLADDGFEVGPEGPDRELALIHGATVCAYLNYDFTPEQARRYVGHQFPSATPQQTGGFVRAAQDTLCVSAYTPVEDGW